MPACTAELNLWVCDWNICPEQLRGFMWSSVEALGQKRKTKEIWCFSQESLRLHCFVWDSLFPYLWILPLYPHPNHCIHERVFWKETKGGHTCGLEGIAVLHSAFSLSLSTWPLLIPGLLLGLELQIAPTLKGLVADSQIKCKLGIHAGVWDIWKYAKVRLLMGSVKGKMQREPALCFGKNQQEAAVCRSWYPEKIEKARRLLWSGETWKPQRSKVHEWRVMSQHRQLLRWEGKRPFNLKIQH